METVTTLSRIKTALQVTRQYPRNIWLKRLRKRTEKAIAGYASRAGLQYRMLPDQIRICLTKEDELVCSFDFIVEDKKPILLARKTLISQLTPGMGSFVRGSVYALSFQGKNLTGDRLKVAENFVGLERRLRQSIWKPMRSILLEIAEFTSRADDIRGFLHGEFNYLMDISLN